MRHDGVDIIKDPDASWSDKNERPYDLPINRYMKYPDASWRRPYHPPINRYIKDPDASWSDKNERPNHPPIDVLWE
jgi:hypothetical protein